MEYFSEDQTRMILEETGLNVVSDTHKVWMALCPYHGNTDVNSPAFAVNKESGKFFCFNGACGAQGDITSLVTYLTGKTNIQARMLIARVKSMKSINLTDAITKELEEEKMPSFSGAVIDKTAASFWESEDASKYMLDRGLNKATLQHYKVGYSRAKGLITVPMYDAMGSPVGVVGRTLRGKRFRNSNDLPRRLTLWNMHRAKKHPQTVICESTYDAMKVWQATGIEAVAVLGSHFSEHHKQQLNKYFTHLIIMTDDDQELTVRPNCRDCRANGENSCVGHNTGLELGKKIADSCRGMVVQWAHLNSLKRYDGVKDAMDLTDDQVTYAIENAISNFEMSRRHLTGTVV